MRAVVMAAALALACCGCYAYRGGKVVEGTDVAIGMSVPQSGGTLQVDALNFLTGFRFLFCEDAGVKCSYSVTNTVSMLGCYSSSTVKAIEVELVPVAEETAEDR